MQVWSTSVILWLFQYCHNLEVGNPLSYATNMLPFLVYFFWRFDILNFMTWVLHLLCKWLNLFFCYVKSNLCVKWNKTALWPPFYLVIQYRTLSISTLLWSWMLAFHLSALLHHFNSKVHHPVVGSFELSARRYLPIENLTLMTLSRGEASTATRSLGQDEQFFICPFF